MNISSWIENWAVANPDKTAIRFEGREISYREFNAEIKANARLLKHQLGIKTGDRIAYLGQNDPKMLVFVFSCARLGAIFVPLNWRLAPVEHQHMLADSGASLFFVDEPYVEQCEALKSDLANCQFIAVQGETKSDWPTLPALPRQEEGDDEYPGIGPGAPMLIVYTSGTTGFPKGAVLTQEAIQYNALNSTVMHDLTSEDVILTLLPLFHVGGLNNQTTAGFHAGATVILHRVFDPAAALRSIVDEKSTMTIILPAHMPALRGLPDWETADLSSLRSVLTGSTAIPDEMINYWHGKGIPLLQVYGSTETCPIAINQTIRNAFRTEGTIGYAAMHCEIRIVDEQGNDCGVDEPGEILVRGRNVMTHYWNNEEATKANLKDGWFHSGDIGYVDEAGCYHFVDRKKDVIISGAENIYPAEIENVLTSHSDILEIAVVGRKDPKWGEAVIAVVVKEQDRELDKDGVLGWLDGKLGRYKHPRDVIFMDALPRNAMRKVEKGVLREMVNKSA